MKSQLLKLAKSASDEAFDWSSDKPAPSREPTTLVHRFSSEYRSPFDAFVYMNRIPIEARSTRRSSGACVKNRKPTRQSGRASPNQTASDNEAGLLTKASRNSCRPGLGRLRQSCFTCHHLPALGHVHRDQPVPTLRNRTYTRQQLSKSLDRKPTK